MRDARQAGPSAIDEQGARVSAIDDRRLSRVVAHVLRHRPEQYGLLLDAGGWVAVDALVAALRRHRREWSGLSRGDLERMIRRSEKPRFEVDDGRIRARYGHSVPATVVQVPTQPPDRLFHGTTPASAGRILMEGLRPMRRRFVHLSADRTDAWAVGRRRAVDPVVLSIHAGAAHDAGVAFYRAAEGIWLADHVPAAFIVGPGSADDRSDSAKPIRPRV